MERLCVPIFRAERAPPSQPGRKEPTGTQSASPLIKGNERPGGDAGVRKSRALRNCLSPGGLHPAFGERRSVSELAEDGDVEGEGVRVRSWVCVPAGWQGGAGRGRARSGVHGERK